MPQHPATPSTALPAFVGRHIGPGEADVAHMLAVVGQPSLDALVDSALPHLDQERRAAQRSRPPSPRPRSSASCVRWPGATGCCDR
jgi:glycine cleavage system pyridoxal-binding protein P